MVYDAMIVLAIWLVTAFLAVALNGGQAVTGPTFQSVLFVELFAFFAGFWVGRGQTVGMLAWRLHVATTDGAPVQLRHALLRFIDPGQRTWPDMMSGTEVIYTPASRSA